MKYLVRTTRKSPLKIHAMVNDISLVNFENLTHKFTVSFPSQIINQKATIFISLSTNISL